MKKKNKEIDTVMKELPTTANKKKRKRKTKNMIHTCPPTQTLN